MEETREREKTKLLNYLSSKNTFTEILCGATGSLLELKMSRTLLLQEVFERYILLNVCMFIRFII